jgi:signal transduction histidine kinase/ligand-binding sensor domain-containing protein
VCRLGVLALLAVCASSSAAALDLPGVLTGYSIVSWSDEDGRPLGSVYAIAQDLDGYLWVGTDAGLVRFDGWRLARWETISSARLPASPVSALFVSHDGILWVGFRDGAVRQIRERSILSDVATEAAGLVADIAEDGHHIIWAVAGGELRRWTGDRWARVPIQQNRSAVVSVSIARDGTLLVGTTTALYRRDTEHDAFKTVLSGWAWDASEDSRGTLWVTDTSAGFKQANGSNGRIHPLNGNGYRMLHDRGGNLWVATIGEGLWRVPFDGAGKTVVEKASLYSGLLSDSIHSLIEDREGNIWIGTTAGLQRLTERKVTPVVNLGLVTSIEATGDSGVWVGTGDAVIRLSPGATEWKQDRLADPVAPYVRGLHRDVHGALWIFANQGLFKMTGRRVETISLAELDTTTPIVRITSDAHGRIWLSDGSHLITWDGQRASPVPRPSDLAVKRISVIFGDSKARLWIAFAGGALATVEDGRWRVFGAAEGWTGVHRSVYDVFEDEHGVVWILGTGGLTRFSEGVFATLDRRAGLPSSGIGAITDDQSDGLWLNMDVGLVRVTRKAFDHALANPSQRLQYDLYDSSDGVAGAPILNVRARRGSDGTLWFVRGGGLTAVAPRALGRARDTRVPVMIEGALADEARLEPVSGAALAPGTRRVQINYTALTLRAPNRMRFRYRLDGFDPDWVDVGSRRQAFYTNLPPREYTFHVEATTDENAWNGAAATWGFRIRPMFYQTRWFYLIGLLSIALAAVAGWQVRERLIRRQFSAVLGERTRLSREIHDTLLQNMIGVALQFDELAESVGALSADARNKLIRARKQAEGHIREARQSIWDLRSPSLERRELTTALRDVMARTLQDTTIQFEATTVGTPRQFSAQIENALLRIGQEAVTNSMRHANASHIRVELRFDQEGVVLGIHDNGCGFDVPDTIAAMNGHYGLISMQERAEDIEARFSIVSSKGQGTDVEVSVPFSADESQSVSEA